jgi:hypothetical protein
MNIPSYTIYTKFGQFYLNKKSCHETWNKSKINLLIIGF